MSPEIFARLRQLLVQHDVTPTVLRHAPVYTSAEAAAVRGVALSSGAKALVCKADGDFLMFVIPADRKLASKQIRKEFGYRSLRFANAEEVRRITALEPGSIPPFGSLFGIATWCDQRLGEHDRINFNAADHAVSMSIRYEEYLAAENPQLGRFAE